MSNGTCVVIGAGPGVGLAVARRFLREGYDVALVARRAEALQGYVAELEGAAPVGAAVRGFAGDAGDAASLTAALDAVRDVLGEPDVLVYNAFAVAPGLPSELAPDALAASLAVNLTGALSAAQQVSPSMRERGHGTILLTGGGFALAPSAEWASLSIGKAALRTLALTLAEELEPAGVHAATVTICGHVQPGTRFDPDAIAAEYWRLHTQPAGAWEREVVFR